MTVIELPASCKPRIASGIAGQKGIDAAASGALEPVIQSALGIVRESAGLLFHIAGFGVALVSDANISRPKRNIGRTQPAARESANVILFPARNVKPPARAVTKPGLNQDSTGRNHDCDQ
jgi:hypothetical protein